ncbi:MAG TPA: SAM-dependent methyltransferase [Terracidiphilus sp.]|nr:SAM-dependent methyltransferase [Terracidiphilus sp.]
MEPGSASKTAFRVALHRAVHQALDRPPVLEDPIAIPLLGSSFAYDPASEATRFARSFRAFMAARSRYAEDRLAQSVARGVAQYVLLGAGLDTFAYRNPFPRLRVFEVDFPATQDWKRALLAEAAVAAPPSLTFVPIDFEAQALAAALAQAGFDAQAPAFFAWLGVVPYLSIEAFRATLAFIAALPASSGVSFDYSLSPASFGLVRRIAFERLADRVAAAGEPFRLFFTPEDLSAEFCRAGFRSFEHHDADALNALYFAARADGLALPSPGMGQMATAWT